MKTSRFGESSSERITEKSQENAMNAPKVRKVHQTDNLDIIGEIAASDVLTDNNYLGMNF
jgi:hypothetical protein